MHMPIQSVWDDTHCSILRTTHIGIWTWGELQAHDENVVLPMLRSVDHPVAMIVDLRRAFWVMPGSIIRNLQAQIDRYADGNVDIVVFVSTKEAVRSLLVTVHHRYGLFDRHYCTASSMAEARQTIQNMRRRN